ncbi:MAG: chemotaxis protein CheW [Proteobacteria bacterium]|nr:chemotaxis protein CheW [Pseudomonadota bacterium]
MSITTSSSEFEKNLEPMLEIFLHDTPCCIALENVVRILPLMALQPIPKSPAHIKGMFSLSGESVCVIDLVEYSGLSHNKPYSIDTEVILCSYKSRLCGLIASQLGNMSQVQSDDVQMADDFKEANPLFHGVVETEKGLSLLLDLEFILSFCKMLDKKALKNTPAELLSKAKSEIL